LALVAHLSDMRLYEASNIKTIQAIYLALIEESDRHLKPGGLEGVIALALCIST